MKIENELERLLLLQQQGIDSRQGQTQVDPAKFSQVLGQSANQTISDESKMQILQSMADPNRLLNIGISNLAGLESDADQDYEEMLLSMLSNYDNLLNGLGSYASMLSVQDNADLRTAWSMLNSLDGQAGVFRAALQNLNGDTTGLEDLISEVEILIAAEQFKLNRGDYF